MRLARTALAILALGAAALAAKEPGGLLTSKADVPLPEGRWTAPVLSPDGRFLVFTSEECRGLKLLALETGRITTLSEAAGAGFHATWSPDSTAIAFRTTTGGPEPKLRIVVAHPDGVTETASRLERSLSLPLWQEDTLCFFRFQGETPLLQRVGPREAPARPGLPAASPDGRLWLPAPRGEGFEAAPSASKVFYLPVPSPDGRSFVAECLDGHLYLGSVEGGPLEDLGPGSYPSFVRDGTVLLFERTADDGHTLVASDIFLMDLKTREVLAVTSTEDRLERRPRMAGDGHALYFEEGGRILTGWVP